MDVKTVQKLARHSDARTTMNVYAHTEAAAAAAAIAALPPSVPPTAPRREAATGTHGKPDVRNLDEDDPPPTLKLHRPAPP